MAVGAVAPSAGRARLAKPHTRLYDSQGNLVRWITAAEERHFVDEEHYEDHFEMRGKTPHKIGIRPRTRNSRIEGDPFDGSPTSLSEFDSWANVGITPGDPGFPANANAVHRAQAKVAAWPHVGDDKAIRVGVRT